ncbi:hypothetical protein NEIELOOT_00725 [Neisseria elongata subsp. glycolytica ATCC 29315]|uniref:Uncharacterized protein n=1 Tax=Neisseria elongata subsp. glycolytica ATCC 29315 TaxID=546263 RepID=D4DNU1_NEIEG|nr:hypothetical protein NEIELOOT_00725 [Neisseria elongata subsp. glycolytica ATCC 29315]
MVRPANLRKFKSPLITDYFPYISVQKITHFLSNQSKSWCKFFPAPALLKPTPHKDFRRFFLLPTQCKNKHLPTNAGQTVICRQNIFVIIQFLQLADAILALRPSEKSTFRRPLSSEYSLQRITAADIASI